MFDQKYLHKLSIVEQREITKWKEKHKIRYLSNFLRNHIVIVWFAFDFATWNLDIFFTSMILIFNPKIITEITLNLLCNIVIFMVDVFIIQMHFVLIQILVVLWFYTLINRLRLGDIVVTSEFIQWSIGENLFDGLHIYKWCIDIHCPVALIVDWKKEIFLVRRLYNIAYYA